MNGVARRAGRHDLMVGAVAALLVHTGALAWWIVTAKDIDVAAPIALAPMNVVFVHAAAPRPVARAAAVTEPALADTLPSAVTPAANRAPVAAPLAFPAPRLPATHAAPLAFAPKPIPLARMHTIRPAPPTIPGPVPAPAATLPDAAPPALPSPSPIEPLVALAATGAPEVVPPAVIGNTRPAYPRTARARGYEGTVELRLHVRATGAPDAIEILHSSGYATLDRAAVRAAERWRFHPARENGRAVALWVEIPVEFMLSGDVRR